MATNLRLRADAEAAVRAEAARTGRSQQELIREAVDEYLHLKGPATPLTALEALIATGAVLPARSAFREVDETISLPAGATSIDLLNRAERI